MSESGSQLSDSGIPGSVSGREFDSCSDDYYTNSEIEQEAEHSDGANPLDILNDHLDSGDEYFVGGEPVEPEDDPPVGSILAFGKKISRAEYLEQKKNEPVVVRTQSKPAAAPTKESKAAKQREQARLRQQKRRATQAALNPGGKKRRRSVNVVLGDGVCVLGDDDEVANAEQRASPSSSKRAPGRPRDSRTKQRRQYKNKDVPNPGQPKRRVRMLPTHGSLQCCANSNSNEGLCQSSSIHLFDTINTMLFVQEV